MLEYFPLVIRSLRMLVCGTGRLYIGKHIIEAHTAYDTS